MKRLRSLAGIVVVVGVTALAGLGWWSVLASERDALRAADAGARQAAIGAALAVEQATQAGTSIADAAHLARTPGASGIVVRDASGTVVAGRATPGARSVSVRLPAGGSVSAEVSLTRDDLGVGRYGNTIIVVSLLVLVSSLFGLGALLRDRRKAHAEVARLGRKFHEVAVIDELTGFGNRVRMLADLGNLVARGHRYGSQVGLAVFAVDGLDTSDTMMKAVAQVLATQARAADSCFRIAPNRIAVVLAEQDEVGAAMAAERIRSAVVLSGLTTASVGVTALGVAEGASAAELVQRAEAAAGEAAAEGGNRVVEALVLRPATV
jgi:diguanylate cyclase (GGDEF)-like protein